MTWHILTTDPRREFSVAGHLVGHGVTTYLPTYQASVGAGRLSRLTDRPLFPGYLFARIAGGGAWKAVHAAAGYSGYLRSGDEPATLSDAAIAMVRQVEEELAAKAKVRVEKFRTGDHVRIEEEKNPWTGLLGIVKTLDKSDRVTIELIQYDSWRVSVPIESLRSA